MPTYDYECDACGHSFELFQSIKESPKRKCPECGKLRLRRLFGAGAAIVFKGSGFYQTDYRSDSYRKSAEAERKAGGSAKSDSSSSNGKSSEGKTTAKSETSSKATAAAGD